MTPSDAIARLRQIGDERRRLDDEEDHLLAWLEGEAPRPALALPAPAPVRREGRRVGISAAEKISGRSRTSLYRDAEKYGFGFQLPSRAWIFDEEKLRDFLAGEFGAIGANGANGAAEPIDVTPLLNHHGVTR